TTTVTSMHAALDNDHFAEVLVEYEVDRSGIATSTEKKLTDYAPVQSAKVNFLLQKRAGAWLIAQLIYIKAHA
ncbi:MAG TPA: hypothetical protein VFH66_02360, partial [Mycobacteriales bacterium]|nr:hypothetical protein [Mycobacteriales bacterium]